MKLEEELKTILKEVLQLGDRVDSFDRDTRLLGEIPEFDSMAVVSLVTTIEENIGVAFDDEDITADTFDTLGTLVDFVNERMDR